jgi:hypothetical protein
LRLHIFDAKLQKRIKLGKMDSNLAKTFVTTYISRSVGKGKKKVRGFK